MTRVIQQRNVTPERYLCIKSAFDSVRTTQAGNVSYVTIACKSNSRVTLLDEGPTCITRSVTRLGSVVASAIVRTEDVV